MPQKVLLLTKNYPPQIGGIEKYSYDLYYKLVQNWNQVKIIAAWPRNEWILAKTWTGSSLIRISWKLCYIISELWRFSFFATRCLTIGLFYSYISGIVWSLDGSIAPLGFFLGKMTNTKTRVTIHGTDIVWNRMFYQALVPIIIAKMDEVYVVSENTRQECLRRWIPVSRITLVPHTPDTITFTNPGEFDKNIFLKSLWIEKLGAKIILFSIGRWIERKWFHWFLENVMPALDPEKFHYILAGFGPYESVYKKIILDKWLHNVFILWKVDNPTEKAKLYTVANVFIMPNIFTEGNIEGYPLVLMEAKYYWLRTCIGHVQGADNDVNSFFGENDVGKWIDYFQEM